MGETLCGEGFIFKKSHHGPSRHISNIECTVLHFCPTSHIFLTEEGVLSSTWGPPPLSLCPQGHLSTPPLTVSASSPPCSTHWIHIPSPIRPISAWSLQPNPRSSFSIPTLKRMRHAPLNRKMLVGSSRVLIFKVLFHSHWEEVGDEVLQLWGVS